MAWHDSTKAGLRFVTLHLNKSQVFWKNNVLWTDKTKVEYIKHININFLIPTVKHCGGGVMISTCFVVKGPGQLVVTESSELKQCHKYPSIHPSFHVIAANGGSTILGCTLFFTELHRGLWKLFHVTIFYFFGGSILNCHIKNYIQSTVRYPVLKRLNCQLTVSLDMLSHTRCGTQNNWHSIYCWSLAYSRSTFGSEAHNLQSERTSQQDGNINVISKQVHW